MDMSNAKKCIADLQQQLQIADTRCGSLKSQLNYMKMLYHDVRPETEEEKQTKDNLESHNELISKKSAILSDKTDAKNEDQGTVSTQMNCYNYMENIPEILHTPRTQIEGVPTSSPHVSPTCTVSPKFHTQQKEAERIEGSSMKDTEFGLTTFTPRTYSVPQSTRVFSRAVSPIQKENMSYREHADNWEHAYQTSMKDYPSELEQETNEKKSIEQLVLEDQNEYLLQDLSSATGDVKMNIAGSVKNGHITKRKNNIKDDKKERVVSSTLSKKGSISKMDEIMSLKLKRRKGKLRYTNSKSTVTTKDTRVRRKDSKKQKRGGTGTRHVSILKPQRTANEVVEIYHNTAIKSGSASVISSKHSKLDRQTNQTNKTITTINEQQNKYSRLKYENTNYHNRRTTDQRKQENDSLECQSKKKTETSLNVYNQDDKTESVIDPNNAMEKCSSRQQEIIQASYCDPMVSHNYEMPTLASKLKRTNRSYFSRFNFRNIPFVVGTSVTPSHNLGLNIQQVLSIMKTRQAPANGMAPLLIRKVSKGMKPVSVLMDQINEQYSKLSDISTRITSNINSQLINLSDRGENLIVEGTACLLEKESLPARHDEKVSTNRSLQLKPLCMKQFPKMHGNEGMLSEIRSNTYQQNGCTFTNKNMNDMQMLKSFASQQNVKTRTDISRGLLKSHEEGICNGDVYSVQSINSQNAKGIREVLVGLHDQFEEMNTRYEELQLKAEKSEDKTVEKEISALEKELNAKEDEINAVVTLYKEVMALKQQMKQLQEQNSFVCISTEIPMNANKAYSSMPLTLTKSYGMNPQQCVGHRKRNTIAGIREPSTSIRLAGLLRQIQSFQKQLKLTT